MISCLSRTEKKLNKFYSMKKQIIVVKGFEGFADRMQILSHCIQYCKVNDALLCVDWRDDMWGQGHLDFWDFFEIVNVPTITLSDVVNQIDAGVSVEPACWTKKLIAEPFTRNCLNESYYGPLNKLDYEHVDGDVVVVSNGIRMFHSSNLIDNIRLRQDVAIKIQARIKNYFLPCTVVHLRGTDQFDEALIGQCLDKFKELPLHSQARSYVISDMPDLIKKWLEGMPSSEVANKDSTIFMLPNLLKKGSHQHTREILEFYGANKFDLNVDAITEFICLCFASDAVGSEKSTYFSLSRFLNQEGTDAIAKWLHGHKPENKSLKRGML